MAFYAYQAQCSGGTAISGTIEASSSEEAKSRLEEMKLSFIEVTEALPPKSKRPVGYDDFVFFNDQLASLAKAGVALDEGLRQVAADLNSPGLRQVVNQIADELRRGVPLDKAVAAHEHRLPVLYSRVVRAGVENGQLSATLMNLSQHLRLLAESRRVVLESLSYPLIVLTAAAAVFYFVVVMLVPQFEGLFADFDAQLPVLTHSMFVLGRNLPQIALGIAVLVIVQVSTWILLSLRPGGRAIRERFVLGLPLVGRLVRTSLLARFHRAVALAVTSGLPLPEAVRMAAGSTGSPRLAGDAERVAQRMEAGESASRACQSAALMPSLFGYVVDISSDRNSTPEAMIQLANAYRMRASHYVTMVRAWLVPAAVIFLGMSVGTCILALFLPLVSLLNSVSGG